MKESKLINQNIFQNAGVDKAKAFIVNLCKLLLSNSWKESHIM